MLTLRHIEILAIRDILKNNSEDSWSQFSNADIARYGEKYGINDISKFVDKVLTLGIGENSDSSQHMTNDYI